MPAVAGRLVSFTPSGSGVVVLGMRSKSITINNEPIDITSDDDDGWRTYLDEHPAERSIEMSVSGVTKDNALMRLASEGGNQLISEYTLTVPGLGSWTGDFHIGTVTLTAETKDAVAFETTITSSGPMVFDEITP